MSNPEGRSLRVRVRGRIATRCQRGASLVELLVGLTVGLIVIAGALATLDTARSTSASISDLSQLQQQGSYALRVIGTQIRQAGSVEPVEGAHNNLFSFNEATATGAANASSEVSAVSGTEGGSARTDTVSVSHQQASTASQGRDCLGELIGSLRAEGTFFVDNTELRCKTARKNQALISNVADFQVWYRVRTAPDATQRMTADQVKAAALWRSVKSIEICLHLTGNRGGHPGSANVTGCLGESTPRNGRLQLVFHNVFDLRSQGT